MPNDPSLAQTIVLKPEDDVAIARAALASGAVLADPLGSLTVRADIPAGHKVARRDVAEGGPVRRYGQVIGFATTAIAAGDHVHSHNLAFRAVPREYEFGVDVRPVERYAPADMRYFDGFRRPDGRVGTRQLLGQREPRGGLGKEDEERALGGGRRGVRALDHGAGDVARPAGPLVYDDRPMGRTGREERCVSEPCGPRPWSWGRG